MVSKTYSGPERRKLNAMQRRAEDKKWERHRANDMTQDTNTMRNMPVGKPLTDEQREWLPFARSLVRQADAEAAATGALPAAVPESDGVKGWAMALNEVALKLRARYASDQLSTPLWQEFERCRNKMARAAAAPALPAAAEPPDAAEAHRIAVDALQYIGDFFCDDTDGDDWHLKGHALYALERIAELAPASAAQAKPSEPTARVGGAMTKLPALGEPYWLLEDDGEISGWTWEDAGLDLLWLREGRLFATEADATAALAAQKGGAA